MELNGKKSKTLTFDIEYFWELISKSAVFSLSYVQIVQLFGSNFALQSDGENRKQKQLLPEV